MRGGDGVPWPAAGADLFGIFSFLRDFLLENLLVFMRISFLRVLPIVLVLRPCYHALRQPVGAADRARMHN